MTKRQEPSAADVGRQVRQHLESLRAAGVEWLPTAPVVAASVEPPSLFVEPTPPPAAPPAPPDERRRELTLLANRVASCTRCPELASTRTQTVFGVGRVDPEVCFLGEAPGADEDAKGEPFVGKAGKLLTKIIEACGWKREDVYICNILRCRPPGNRNPTPDEAAHCREYLDKQLDLVRPKFIVALGAVAVKFLLNTSVGITKLRGKYLAYKDTPVLCTFHPSYLLRVDSAKRDVWEDMKSLLTRLGKPIPAKK
jgi:DNA polymerase